MWGGIIQKQNVFWVTGYIIQAHIHFINLSATEDKHHPEEKKTFKKRKQYWINKTSCYPSHSDGMMRLRIKELWGVLEWQKYFFQVGYFKRQITSNLWWEYAYYITNKNWSMRGSCVQWNELYYLLFACKES